MLRSKMPSIPESTEPRRIGQLPALNLAPSSVPAVAINQKKPLPSRSTRPMPAMPAVAVSTSDHSFLPPSRKPKHRVAPLSLPGLNWPLNPEDTKTENEIELEDTAPQAPMKQNHSTDGSSFAPPPGTAWGARPRTAWGAPRSTGRPPCSASSDDDSVESFETCRPARSPR